MEVAGALGLPPFRLTMDEHAELVRSQFLAEKEEGLMINMTVREAIAEWGDELNIASTAAIAKKGRTDEVKVLYDGTHGLDLNPARDPCP